MAQRQNSFDLAPQMSLPLSPTCSKHSAMVSLPLLPVVFLSFVCVQFLAVMAVAAICADFTCCLCTEPPGLVNVIVIENKRIKRTVS